MSRVTHSEPGLPMATQSISLSLFCAENLSLAKWRCHWPSPCLWRLASTKLLVDRPVSGSCHVHSVYLPYLNIKTLLVEVFYSEYSRTSPQRPPWTQTRVAVGETRLQCFFRGCNIILKWLFVSPWLTGRCQPFSIGSWEAFKWPCHCGEVAVPDPLHRLIFFRPGEIGLLYALNDYDFYRLYKMYYSLSVGNFQEALEDLYCVEEITGKSKFFLTLSLCLYTLVRFFFPLDT